MYGLMKAHHCSRHGDEANRHRMHYCGTCKTMGTLYGQKSRFLLNNDAVFLSELLSALAPEPTPLAEWGPAYQSYNCLTLPEKSDTMPLALQVAASATLVMMEFKMSDQIADSAKGGWRLAQRLFSQNFSEATHRLKAWGFPMATLWEWYQKQEPREAEVRSGMYSGTDTEMIASVAEPTAVVTGLVFQHGAQIIGANSAVQAEMYTLGFAFGNLVYTLDAYEDYTQDVRKGDFNALQTAFGTDGETLTDEQSSCVVACLQRWQNCIETALRHLPLPQTERDKFSTRMKTNLNRRLGLENTASCVPSAQPALSLRERWNLSVTLSRQLTAIHRTEYPTLYHRLTLPFSFLTVLSVRLLMPQQAKRATSVRHCREIASNLMFLGTALNALVSGTARRIPAFAGMPGSSTPLLKMDQGVPHSSSTAPTHVTKVKKRSCCGGCCDGCTCDCCDCCADGVCCCELSSCCGEGCSCCESGACCCEGCSCS